MKTSNTVLTTVATLLLLTFTAHAEGPCKDKREAKHEANKTFQDCLKNWQKKMKPGEADPSDDCTSKFQAVQNASKSLKACRTDALSKKNDKKSAE
ncbi:MAG: hypothetical protein KA715_14160 [Xanthomonadaceae bacterium]|nr:hypothetical protein [Xanthomonadaceae bacterium]